MGTVFRRTKERRTGTKPPKTMVCPVCKGVAHVRMSPDEANAWHDRVEAGKRGGAAPVVRPCWACGGSGQMPVERRKATQIGHFSR
jgi:hypothetical protein